MIPEPVINTVLDGGALTGSYADKGSAVNIKGCTDVTLHVISNSGAGDVVVKVFLSYGSTAPTATTNMQQLCTSTGAEIEYTCLSGEKASFALNCSANYLMLQAKYSATAANADLVVTAVPVSAR